MTTQTEPRELRSPGRSAEAVPDGPNQAGRLPEGPATVTLITPPIRWQLVDVGELWRHRELVGFLVWRDVKVRYKQTLLGAAWAVLQPALMMVVFTIVFGRMAGVSSGDVPYPLFAYAGLLPWTFFATAVASGGNSVIGSERLITKIYFPRLAIPMAAVGAAVVDFVVAFGLLVAMMLYYGVSPGPGMLLVPVIFLPIVVAGLGIGTLLAALNVSYRDFRYVIPFLVQLWMFATPTVYMQVSEGATHGQGAWSALVRAVLTLNPMTGLIGAFRSAVLNWPIPWTALAVSSVGAVLALFFGCLYFRQVEDRLADVI